MNDNKHISISLFRVSADSKYLDMIFDCPADFYFDTLTLLVKYPEDNIIKTLNFDLSSALFNTLPVETNTIYKKHWIIRLPLEKIGIQVPAIYSAYIRASYLYIPYSENLDYGIPMPYKESEGYWMNLETLNVYDENDNYVGVKGIKFDDCVQLPEAITDWMVCSDVNMAYKCMLSDLLNSDNLSSYCVPISDDAIRKYLLLYGHQAALTVGDDEVAEKFFKLIVNCFNLCGKSCGCEVPHKKSESHNCNCRKK